jgi:hypothetical protein
MFFINWKTLKKTWNDLKMTSIMEFFLMHVFKLSYNTTYFWVNKNFKILKFNL